MKTVLGRTLTLAAAGVFLVACGEEKQDHEHTHPEVKLTVPFRAMVGAQAFACGQTYTGLGTTGTTYQPKDFRLYVHNVRLVSTSGAEVPVTLTDDGVWQGDGVALLDFEDRTGLCSNGTEGTNAQLVGTAEGGHYSGLRFTVGVPFDKNHRAMESNRPPLKVPLLYWAWQGGYKFLRLDGNTAGLPNGHNLHLGSADCQTSAPNVVTGCDHPNRFEVEIPDFDPEKPSTVVLDVAALFATSNLDANQADTMPGCMSIASDADCGPLFQRLGLPFGGTAAGAQVFFRKE